MEPEIISKPLFSVSPKLFRIITGELEKRYHIQPYDIKADAVHEKDGIRVIIRYGRDFSNFESKLFKANEIDEQNLEIQEFIEETGESCKKMLIDDYFKIMTDKTV